MTLPYRLSLLLAGSVLIAGCATAPSIVATAPAPVPASPPALSAEPAPLPSLAAQIAIPHSEFKLDNGLTVLVHEDRKAPVVAVSLWYNVGSKDEPKGKTGFAHLFEHLMFYGSDNVREGIMPFLEKLGATDWNGSTWFDRTNYYETVPKGSLERALFMESDRMGYLLPAIDQSRLDLQRGVVQNEKRQGDNQPGGLVGYTVLETLFPEGHPYHHDSIGSMADLDRASLADVKQWFLDKYGPNNAVLALAGDIDVAEARVLAEKYFGSIRSGPANVPAAADVPTLPEPRSIVMKDQVATVQVQRHWAVPGLLSDQLAPLDIGAAVLGGLSSSRLDKYLVREEKIAVSVSANLQPFHRVGLFEVSASVKPGVDPALVEKRIDEIVAQMLAEGPTDDEIRRAAMSDVSGRIRSLEKVGDDGGKASTLAQGKLYAGDANFFRRLLDAYAATTPGQVRDSMRRWLGRPVLKLRLEPGERPPYVDAKGAKPGAKEDIKVASVKRAMPPLVPTPPLDFPTIERTSLANGLKVTFAHRDAAPLTHVVLSFDAGFSADRPDERGLQNMAVNLLDEGTEGHSAQELAEAQERLGTRISASGGADRSAVALSTLTANLIPSLALMTEVVQKPAFASAEIERVRTQLLTAIAQAKTSPGAMASRAMPALLYGPDHPYATTALGSEEKVKGFTREQLIAFKERWLRPDNGELFVVSSLPLAEIKPLLEAALGNWQPPATPRGRKAFAALPKRPAAPRIFLIDRPDSPQSLIYAGEVTPIDPRAENSAIFAGSEVLGGGSGSRIFMDLRERRGWSYGASGSPQLNVAAVPYLLQTSVQANRTGDSIAALMDQLNGIVGPKGVAEDELARVVARTIGGLPGQFETGAAVLDAMQRMTLYGRPDDYYERLPERYRALTPGSVDEALRQAIDPKALTFVVVGDAAKVKPQLKRLKMPVEVIAAR